MHADVAARSTRDLLAQLTAGRHALAFDALLDLTGQFRTLSPPPTTADAALHDVLTTLSLHGRVEDAARLRALADQLTQPLDPVLVVLLACARNLDVSPPAIPPPVFGHDRLSASSIPLHSPMSRPKLFHHPQLDQVPSRDDDDHEPAAPYLYHQPPISPVSASPSSPAANEQRFDYIADAARLLAAHDEQRLQNALHSTDDHVMSVSFIDPHYQSMYHRFVEFVSTASRQSSSNATRLALVRSALAVPRATPSRTPRDDELLYYIRSRCMSDPDVDDVSPTPTSSAPPIAPLGAFLLQSAGPFEQSLSASLQERANCVRRRRAIVNDLSDSSGPALATLLRYNDPAHPHPHAHGHPKPDRVAELIARAAVCGAVFRDLSSFVDGYTLPAIAGGHRVLSAVTRFAARFARAYLYTVQRTASSPSDVVARAQAFVADGALLCEALSAIEGRVDACDIVDECAARAHACQATMQLFYAAVSPYFDYVIDWFFDGSVRRDVGAEFFVTQLARHDDEDMMDIDETPILQDGDDDANNEEHENIINNNNYNNNNSPEAVYPHILSKDDVVFLLRAGKGRRLLSSFGLNRGALAERVPGVRFDDCATNYESLMRRFTTLVDRVESFERDARSPASTARATDRVAEDSRLYAADDHSASPAWHTFRAGHFDIATGRRKRVRNKFCHHEDEMRYVDDVLHEDAVSGNSCIRCLAFRIPDVDGDGVHDRAGNEEERTNGQYRVHHAGVNGHPERRQLFTGNEDEDEGEEEEEGDENDNGNERKDEGENLIKLVSMKNMSCSSSTCKEKIETDTRMDNTKETSTSYDPISIYAEGSDTVHHLFSSVVPDSALQPGISATELEEDSEANVEEVMPRTPHRPRFPLGTELVPKLLEPLGRIDAVVQREVLRHFVEELGLLEHFKTLRSHVLLGAGAFANELIEQVDAAPLAHLNQSLKTALNLCGSAAPGHADMLFIDTPSHEGKDGAELWHAAHVQVRYDVPRPLDIVITADNLQEYSKIFRLFLKVHRAQRSLRWMFMISRRKRASNNGGDTLKKRHTQSSNILSTTTNTTTSASSSMSSIPQSPSSSFSSFSDAVLRDKRVAGRLWHFCWYADHFVSIFGGFVMEQVLGDCWGEFTRKWTSVRSVWELRDTHTLFLQACVRKCLLGDKHRAVLNAMTDGFDIVTRVEREIVALATPGVATWADSTKNVLDLLTSSTAGLKRRCALLTDVLNRLLDRGTLPHLEYLLTRLNFNHYYETTGLMSSSTSSL